ncbi:MAG TPA: hypothetical protein VKS60_11355 [Stellaceae bacterium]|nr:hypothetical protein [Stellaceae bacterium]
MSVFGDAIDAVKRVLLLQERIAAQSQKLDRLGEAVGQLDRRLALVEGRMEGFLAAAAAFSAADRPLPEQRRLK